MLFLKSFFTAKDGQTFEELIKKEQTKLYKIAFSYVRNEQDALDIVQDSIIKGFKGFEKLNDKQYFSTWMTRILLNTAMDYLKRKRDVVLLDPTWFNPGISQENSTITALDLADVFEKLKPEQKTLILLRYYYGYSIPEIAKIVDKPVGTIKSQLHRTLQSIKEKLENGGDTYGKVSTRY
ncbi:sigma-70 family RNA polymerase sigma factor [Bacillus sp. FJAT-27225]|uniref:sigma-70 family RNA polymerase sigma factor n=1 Tax=Bacillus sp. FJAT-27225 TaxID=1743144 RepID=UPI000980DE29|nr:sigma-70 family RNA polymerase sigma factor [Bacillus sp. FJAT-27225]